MSSTQLSRRSLVSSAAALPALAMPAAAVDLADPSHPDAELSAARRAARADREGMPNTVGDRSETQACTKKRSTRTRRAAGL